MNWYRAKTLCLVIILTDDAIKYTCIWPLAWHNKYKPYNSSTPLQRFLTFSSTSQREREAIKDSVLWEKTGSILPPLVGLMAGRQAGWQMKYGGFQNFLNALQVILFRLLFCLIGMSLSEPHHYEDNGKIYLLAWLLDCLIHHSLYDWKSFKSKPKLHQVHEWSIKC